MSDQRSNDPDRAESEEAKPSETAPGVKTPTEKAREDDERLNETIDESFPASDPPSYTGTTAG